MDAIILTLRLSHTAQLCSLLTSFPCASKPFCTWFPFPSLLLGLSRSLAFAPVCKVRLSHCVAGNSALASSPAHRQSFCLTTTCSVFNLSSSLHVKSGWSSCPSYHLTLHTTQTTSGPASSIGKNQIIPCHPSLEKVRKVEGQRHVSVSRVFLP